MSKISDKIIYFSGLYPSKINRGMPFIDNRLNLLKKRGLSSKIYFLNKRDTKFAATVKKLLFRQKKIEVNSSVNQNATSNWYPIDYKNNLAFILLNLFSKKNKNRYLSRIIKKEIPEITNIKLVHLHWAYPTGYIF
ncbi:MAG TPA: hypothetical protein VKO43_04490, partial [Candidatus Krumholzibacteriaceae bacterium]|nr:hypothetical protein [Candidatus Krumholzibacteriaceae bacterium]